MLINECIGTPTTELWGKIIKELQGTYKDVMYKPNAFLFMTNYNSPLLLQAHMDTKRDEKNELVMTIEHQSIIRAKNSVLGADDRAGVYSILKLVTFCKDKQITPPTILFTDEEETGSAGMKKFVKAVKKKKLRKINLAIALDREGCGQYVFYNDIDKRVGNYIESFGFYERRGTFSDISIFQKEYLIPAVNLSVGFYRQHTHMEELHYDETLLTINRMKKIIQKPIEKRYEIELEKKVVPVTNDTTYGYGSWNRKYDNRTGTNTYNKDFYKTYATYQNGQMQFMGLCELCNKWRLLSFSKDVEMELCPSCKRELETKEKSKQKSLVLIEGGEKTQH